MQRRGWRYAAVKVFTLVVCCAVAVACGDDAGSDDNQADVTQGRGGNDLGISEDTANTDTGPEDSGSEDSGALDDTGEDTDDAGATPKECPGGPNCPCLEHGECDTGICLDYASDKRCAGKCVDSCPEEGQACVSFTGGGGDTTNVCAPVQAWLCDPCTKSSQCQHVGINDAVCVDQGIANGSFCGVACNDDKGCPSGYGCKPATSVEGASTSQCVPVDGKELTTCACSDAAKAKKLQTTCAIVNKDDKGNIVSKCDGVRKCEEAGLSKCVGPSPEAETCDGIDNDCNGKTDENTCDDKNGCTTDACKPADKSCLHAKLDGPCDADGSKCTQSDSCTDGVCLPGKTKQCDDGNPCTLDGCVALTGGCTATADNGKACEADGNPCTVGDNCVKGTCTAGKEKPCVAANKPCIAGSCSPTNGNCAFAERPDGTACNDSTLCTDNDACTKGLCLGKPVNCDDKNACTNDSCTPKAGCANSATTQPCDDDDKCTGNDSCKGGACAGLPANITKTCDDGNACTIDSCSSKTGCASSSSNGTCSDGDACSTGDACVAGTCKAGGKANCDDGNACTLNSCEPKVGCKTTVSVGKKFTCYDGPKGTDKLGHCKAGEQTCGKEGKLGPCGGQVLPASKEKCDGKDDTCDGQTDEGCGAGTLLVTTSNGALQGGAGKYAIDAKVGVQSAISARVTGTKHAIDWGLYRWLKAVFP